MHHILTNRSEIESQFLELLERNITSLTDLIKWIDDSDSIEAKLQNDFAWRYIHQTTHTNNEQYKSEYENFLQTIYPNWIQISDKIGRKLIDNEFVSELPTTYHNLIRSTKHAIELYREENVPLLSQQQAIESEYSELIGAMSVEYKGEILTMAQAAQYLKNPDRSIRKELFELMEQRRKSDAEKFDDILTRLIHIRTEIAKNCGFESYTQYAYSRRFDYTQSQIHTFHKSIQQVITPLGEKLCAIRKEKLGLDNLKPYDFQIGLFDASEGDVFSSQHDMLNKIKQLYGAMDPIFAQHISEMEEQGLLDLATRPSKASNGYNYPFAKSPYGFIFMNDMLDMKAWFTMAHEGGHALHHRLTHELEVESFRNVPSELAEIASMSMELFTIDDLDTIGLDEIQVQSTIEEKIADDILTFAWISKIDLFQERLYDHPTHTIAERHTYWLELNRIYPISMRTFDTESRSPEYESYLETFRQRQMHIFENPFYYIEYAIAQLASIQLYQQWTKDRVGAINNYKKILSAGYIHSIPDTIKLGNVEFDMSVEKLQELMGVLEKKYEKLFI